MTDYISREAAIAAAFSATSLGNSAFRDVYDTVSRLRLIPASDVRPVVRGEWKRTDLYPHRIYCSVCFKTYLRNDELLERWEFPLNFCPNCGAQMDMREES